MEHNLVVRSEYLHQPQNDDCQLVLVFEVSTKGCDRRLNNYKLVNANVTKDA